VDHLDLAASRVEGRLAADERVERRSQAVDVAARPDLVDVAGDLQANPFYAGAGDESPEDS